MRSRYCKSPQAVGAPVLFLNYNAAMNITISAQNFAPFSDDFASASLDEKTIAFARMEEAIAFERACLSLDLVASIFAKHRWIKELGLRWSSAAVAKGINLKISPGLGEADPLAQSGSSLAAIIDFSILAAKLAEGSLSESDSSSARSMMESARPAFILGARSSGFNGLSAIDARRELSLAENELGKAFSWASHADADWLPNACFRGIWEKKILRDKADSGSVVAHGLGFPVLAAEIEKREIAHISTDPRSASPRRVL